MSSVNVYVMSLYTSCCFLSPVYGWGAASFSRPESQTPQEVSLAYFKGPAGVQLILDIIDTETGTGMLIIYFL